MRVQGRALEQRDEHGRQRRANGMGVPDLGFPRVFERERGELGLLWLAGKGGGEGDREEVVGETCPSQWERRE